VREANELCLDDTADAAAEDAPNIEQAAPASIAEVLAEPVEPINPPAEEAPLSLLPPPADEEPIDDELLEVFVEELNEVRQSLLEQLPSWQNAPDNRALQTEIRRAFHTLKGSGRMVRALVIGELAWAVENLLNRVLDGSIEVNNAVQSLVIEVNELLPELRNEFAACMQRQRNDVDRLAARAHTLAKAQRNNPLTTVTESEDDTYSDEQPETVTEQDETLSTVLGKIDTEHESAETYTLDTAPSTDELLELELVPASNEQSESWSQELSLLEPADEQSTNKPLTLDKPAEAVVDDKNRDIHLEHLPSADELLEQAAVSDEQTESWLQEFNLPEQSCQPSTDAQSADETQTADKPAEAQSNDDNQAIIIDSLSSVDELLEQAAATDEQAEDWLKDFTLQSAEFTNESAEDWLKDHTPPSFPPTDEASDKQDSTADEPQKIEGVDEDIFLDELSNVDELLEQAAAIDEQAGAWLKDFAPSEQSAIDQEESTNETQDTEEAALDKELLEIFHQEAQAHLDTLASFVKSCVEQLPQPATVALQTALHTLKGSAHMAGALPMAQIAAPLEKLIDTLKSQAHPIHLPEASLLGRAGSLLRQGLSQLYQAPLREIPGSAQLLSDIAKLQQQYLNNHNLLHADNQEQVADSAELTNQFLSQGMDLLLESGLLLEQCRNSDSIPPEMGNLLEQLSQLIETAEKIGLKPFAELCDALVTFYHAALSGELSACSDFFDEALKTHELLMSMLDKVVAHADVSAEPEQIAALQAILQAPTPQEPSQDEQESAQSVIEIPSALSATLSFEKSIPQIIASEANSTKHSDDELEVELLAIFLEEGSEIISRASERLQKWIQYPQSERTVWIELQRDLHTLKGSARTTGFLPIGDLAHALEFLYEDLVKEILQTNDALLELLQQGHDRLAVMLEALQKQQTLEDAEDLIDAIARFRDKQEQSQNTQSTSDDEQHTVEQTNEAEPSELINDSPLAEQITPESTSASAPAAPGISAQLAASRNTSSSAAGKVLPFTRRAAQVKVVSPEPQEQIRISADKLDAFSNLAGEISIFRARIEQQVGDFGFALNEMETTIERVRRQLRQLDIETQAQTLSRYQAANPPEDENFDPLEMDRHSDLQQLARGLFESATDLLDLQQALVGQSRYAQTLLLQQARTNSQLQESLMYTRLVRFERVVPRLSRLVRQLSRELDKKVELQVENAQGEMDRTVLDRLNAPLEHMLRNAIDHGIESIEERLASGKQAVGKICLKLTREGGDILLSLKDDGRGIDLEAVHRKAIERGLTDAASELSEQEIRQFVLEPGFSTAQKVSQTSGRGIGMDVVQSEIRRAGGSISIDSKLGQGTSFTIRLPFTVTVSRALMVRTGDDLYALALTTVEGVARLSADELSRQYAQKAPALSYGGQRYTLHYLGDLLGNGQKPKLVGHSLPLPVILLRSGEQHLAVQVDALAGVREIVLKGLSNPFSNIPGISGATILGDGRVVVILDLPSLIRQYQRTQLSRSIAGELKQTQPTDKERPLLVMVVDDSITVRKVTGRLLERHGMNVLTAKDGVEAIALLQEHKPDLMLLDIEMPRMDGFEVASLVRHNEQLKNLPIIMITSRTGAKHRERGFSLGVNDFLGKPYQEAQLLGRIEQLTYQPQQRHA